MFSPPEGALEPVYHITPADRANWASEPVVKWPLAQAFRLGTARALSTYEADLRKVLKAEGFLKRDPRAKERRKFGLKKARKSPQWSKR